uniref:Cytochrome b6-f complex subunit PetP n=1 Tax=Vertebrata australis TaxID=1967852 RepID=A0A1Z1MIV0_9FLOR|nr:cytochrome b6-f complex subunit PetP [Vertebrata australis]ARW65819.1 cytochrome b6-f complex subunit PetP [Vertebrata australis]
MKIKFIPKKIKKILGISKYTEFKLKGYKKISAEKKINIIQLTNKNRVWIIPEEI